MNAPAAAPASGGRRLLLRALFGAGLVLNFLTLLLWLALAGLDAGLFVATLFTLSGLIFLVVPIATIAVAALLWARGRTTAAAVFALVSGLAQFLL